MTVLGKHTIQETEDLMKTVEFRIKAGDKVNNQITEPQIRANLDRYTDLQVDWRDFKARWATGRDRLLDKLLIMKLSTPLVSNSLLASEGEYREVKKLINVGGEDTFAKGDLTDCLNRIEALSGQQINEKDAPMPAGFDPDLAAYKKVDDAIKDGEA